MSDDPRLQSLFDKLLDSQSTPEEVCASCPELLPQVRRRWNRLDRVRSQLDVLFPPWSATDRPAPAHLQENSVLPQLPGYEVEAVLGRGGMGVVYQARHLRLNRTVALKMLVAGPHAGPEELERFLREAEAVAGLHHPNIVELYDAGEVEGRPYFTMQLVEGGNLAQKLAAAPLSPRSAAELIAAVADAIEVAHQAGIIHRDLKPANVLLAAGGTPKVTDFGLARRLEDRDGQTLSGAALGTPSYMAPEQARGDKGAISPATDVYSLGAILYEMLTGRPPFRAESASATLQQVIADEPVPPARLNPQLPRDLETICLKCLNKERARRYASAAALADDLRRFGRGEPIVARPATPRERLFRWTRRHPARATLFAATALVALTVACGGAWMITQRIQTMDAVEADLRDVVRLQQLSALPESRAILARAHARLGDIESARVRSVMDQAQHDQQLLERLEAIRVDRSTFVEGRDNHLADVRFNNAQADRQYQDAFQQAMLGEPRNDPDMVAAQIKASALRWPLVAALDDWAACCADSVRRSWVLRVARGADPDPWRDRVRDPAAWEDRAVLDELAQTARVAQQPPSVLLALGERLQLAGGDGVALLQRIERQYPDDFWTNFTLANTLYGLGKQGKADLARAAVYYQKALALRPSAVAAHNNLGLMLYGRYWLDDDAKDWGGPGALTVYRTALRIDPQCAPAHHNLGLALKAMGLLGGAAHEYQEALRLNPNLAPAHFNLGIIQAATGDINGAISHYRQALRIDPDFAVAHYDLGMALVSKGRRDEVDHDFPEGVKPLEQFRELALRDTKKYNTQLHDIDPQWIVARNTLQIPAEDTARLEEAIDHYRQAIRIEPSRPRTYAALGQALLAKRQFAEAKAATRRCLELLPSSEKDLRVRLERQQDRCRRLLDLEGRLPCIVQGTDNVATGECLDAAELCFVNEHYAAASRLYTEALGAQPQLTEDLRAGERFNAARAAVLAGCGRGDDAGELMESEKKRLREQARKYLKLDLAAWVNKLHTGTAADHVQAQRTLSRWLEEPDLAGLRNPAALDALAPGERQEWRALWSDVEALLGSTPLSK
jgi:eukaryotic-like serine/threonine-protein kinase